MDDRHDSIVVEGDDPDHVQPAQDRDPFTPEPAPPAKARRAMVAALVLVAAVLVVLLVLAFTR